MIGSSRKTVLLPAHSPALFRAAVEEVVRCLRTGGVVVLPTETVYGLAANALDESAVRRIFEIKGRPSQNPIIVHVSDMAMARSCARAWPAAADKLASRFWPGPLTLVLPKAARIPNVVAAGGDTVGVRWPSHPFMRAVIRACGFPLAAPSANPSNEVSPTEPGHVLGFLEGKVPFIVDGGHSQVGIESTVLDLTASPSRILRPGMIHAGSLSAVIGPVETDVAAEGARLRSPGLLARHYAPRARLLVLQWRDEVDLKRRCEAMGARADRTHVLAHTVIPSGLDWGRVGVVPHDAEAYARALYAEFHACDRAGAEWIVLESVPEHEEWAGIADRLRRAAHGETACRRPA